MVAWIIRLTSMKKHWVLFALALSVVPGCVVPQGGFSSSAPDYQYNPSTGGYVPVAEAAYYDQPLYSYGNVNYYYVSGRYMYDEGYGPTYTDRLPYGGYYNRSHPVYPCRTSPSISYARSRPISSAPVLSVTNKVVVNKTYVQQTNVQQTNIGKVNIGSSGSGVPASQPVAASSGGSSPWGGRTSGGWGSPSSQGGVGGSGARGSASRSSSEPTSTGSRGSVTGAGVPSHGGVPVQSTAAKTGFWGGSSSRPSSMGGGMVRPTTTGASVPKKEVAVGPSVRPSSPPPKSAQSASSAPVRPPSAPVPSPAAPKKKAPGAKPEQP